MSSLTPLADSARERHMRTACLAVAWLSVAGLSSAAPAAPARRPAVNLVTERVHAIATAEGPRDAAQLLVFVVDDSGDPLDTVEVEVLAAGKKIAAGETDARGRTLIRVAFAGPVVVRAVEPGLVPAEARGVSLRQGGLTAVVLPLEALEDAPAEPTDTKR